MEVLQARTIGEPVIIRPKEENDSTPALFVEGEIEATTISARLAKIDELLRDMEIRGIRPSHRTIDRIAIGCLAFPFISIPLSKLANLSAVFRFGPRKLDPRIIAEISPLAKMSCRAIGR